MWCNKKKMESRIFKTASKGIRIGKKKKNKTDYSAPHRESAYKQTEL